jgi:phage shock protein A
MIAKFQSASARLSIQESLDGLSIDAEVQALAGVRDHIKGKVAEARLGTELRESDLDTRLKTLNRTAGAVTARAQLEEMKRAQASAVAASAATGKTL